MFNQFVCLFRGGGGGGGSGGGRGNTCDPSSPDPHDAFPADSDTHAPDVSPNATDLVTSAEQPQNDDIAGVPDLFKGHKLSSASSPDDQSDESSLESYMKRRGRRRPSQDFLDSRHLLPWQRYQENRKYAPVKYTIPEKEERVEAKAAEPYPFHFIPDEPRFSGVPAATEASACGDSPSTDRSGVESEGTRGSGLQTKERASTMEATSALTRVFPSSNQEETDEVDGTIPEFQGSKDDSFLSTLSTIQPRLDADQFHTLPRRGSRERRDEVGPTVSSLVHHKPTVEPVPETGQSIPHQPRHVGQLADLGQPSRQLLTESYYRRRRSHQVAPGTGSPHPASGLSRPKGFQALRGIFETKEAEGNNRGNRHCLCL